MAIVGAYVRKPHTKRTKWMNSHTKQGILEKSNVSIRLNFLQKMNSRTKLSLKAQIKQYTGEVIWPFNVWWLHSGRGNRHIIRIYFQCFKTLILRPIGGGQNKNVFFNFCKQLILNYQNMFQSSICWAPHRTPPSHQHSHYSLLNTLHHTISAGLPEI